MATIIDPNQSYPSVTTYRNGDRLDADTMNKPIAQLAARTDWLHSRLVDLVGNQNFSSVRIYEAACADDVHLGDCVYLDRTDGLFKKALASVVYGSETTPFDILNDQAYSIGIVADRPQRYTAYKRCTILLSGKLDLSQFNINNMMEQSDLSEGALDPGREMFKSGPYYLSSTDPGKLTAYPRGPAVYIGTFFDLRDTVNGEFISPETVVDYNGFAIISPQFKDLGEMHHHRGFVLPAIAQGSVTYNGETIKVRGFEPQAIQPQCSDEEPSVPDIRLFISGAYIDTVRAGYWLKIVNRTVVGDNIATYSETFPDGIPWSDPSIYVEWHEMFSGIAGDTVGYSKLRWNVSRGAYEFTLGSRGLLGWLVVGPGVEPSNYRFGGEEFPTTSVYQNSGQNYLICDTDTKIGWRNADQNVADEVGYTYVYDVGQYPELNKFFPPSPIGGCSLLYNGVELPSYELYGDKCVFRVTNNKILWKSENAGGLTPFAISNDSPPIALTFYLSRGKLPTSSFVTSLKADEGSGIQIREEGTPGPASTGNLIISAKIPIDMSDPGLAGYRVPKDVVNNKLIFGPVVSSIKGGGGILVRSKKGQPNGYGDVTISLDDGRSGGMFDDVVLHNAKQELIGAFPYIKLLAPGAVSSGFTMKTHIPVLAANPEYGYQLVFCASVFGLEDITELGENDAAFAAHVSINASVLQDWYPDMPGDGDHLYTLKDRNNLRIINPNNGVDPDGVQAIPFGGTELVEYSGGRCYYKAFDPIIVHNGWDAKWNEDSPLRHVYVKLDITDLHPNSSIAVTVRRASWVGGGVEDYLGEIGFMNMSWRLVEQTEPSVT